MEIYFATSNSNKFKEAEEILKHQGIAIRHYKFEHNEIRSDSLEEIALEAVDVAYAKLKKPVFVEDTGLFVDALNGFPGTYSAWVQKKIGNRGLLALLREQKERTASFKTCIAFKNPKQTKTFLAECNGKLAEIERGKDGFGYDPLFIPNGENQTFAEKICLKNKYSHRYKSLLMLANYLATDKDQ